MEKRFIPGADHTEELRKVDKALEALENDRMAGLYSSDRGEQSYRRMHGSLSAEYDRLAALPQVPDRWEEIPTGRTLRQYWDRAEDVGDRRAFLKKMGIAVRVHAEPPTRMPLRVAFGLPVPPVDMPPVVSDSRFELLLPLDLEPRIKAHAGSLARKPEATPPIG